jgi:hypothetical protein
MTIATKNAREKTPVAAPTPQAGTSAPISAGGARAQLKGKNYEEQKAALSPATHPIQMKGGVGQAGDKYEAHADAVADMVVQGKSAEGLLSQMTGSRKTAGADVQLKNEGSPSAPAKTWASIARTNFNSWDLNNDGYVGKKETDSLLLNRNIKGEQAAAVAALHKYLEELEELSNDEWGDENDGLTLSDLRQVEKGNLKQVESNFQNSKRQIRSAQTARDNDTLFGNTKTQNELFPNGLPSLDALKQGAIGDCYFLAPLGSLIARNPQAVVDMIKRNTDEHDVPSSYTVTFPGSDGPVTVSVPTDGEVARYSSSGSDGLWLAVVEKAYGKLRAGKDGANRGDKIGGGGTSKQGMNAFTKAGKDRDMLGLTSKSTTQKKLTKYMGSNQIVTAGIGSSNSLHLPSSHEYSVIGWDGTWITLRNPWGSNPDEVPQSADGFMLLDKRGRFKMKMDSFHRVFADITYEEW